MFALTICTAEDYGTVPPALHGPFDTQDEALAYGRDYRLAHNIPGANDVLPSEEDIEAWEEEGFKFFVTPLECEDFTLTAG